MSTDFVVESIPRKPEPIAERFQRDVATHEMVPSLDNGVYRHLRFRRFAPWTDKDGVEHPPSRSSAYWFDLITWPGHLTITGDCGTYTFARTHDMFEFFRSPRGDRINPGYWAEKVSHETVTTKYSPECFEQHVREYIADAADDWPGLAEAAEREIFGDLSMWNTEYEEGAHEALRDFVFGDNWKVTCHCGEVADGLTRSDAVDRIAVHDGAAGHMAHLIDMRFRFEDSWEWNLHDFDWQFLWCCHAIVWGIAAYDRRKAVTA